MPKSSSFTSPGRGHQDVGGLQVAVHDQVAVRVGDRLAHLREQRQALLERRAVLGAEGGDRPALHELHDHVGAAVGGDAAVVQARDARVLEARQDLALGLEALELRARLELQQLDGDALLEAAVGALGLVHLAHAAAADAAGDAPRPEARAGREALVLGSAGEVRGRGQEPGGRLRGGAQQALDLAAHGGVLAGKFGEPRGARRFRQVEQVVQECVRAGLLRGREHATTPTCGPRPGRLRPGRRAVRPCPGRRRAPPGSGCRSRPAAWCAPGPNGSRRCCCRAPDRVSATAG